MGGSEREQALAVLRTRIGRIERGRGGQDSFRPVLPFDVPEIDDRLPERGLPLGALHEVAGGEPDIAHEAAAALFVAGMLARLRGPVLWCLKRRDLFAPGLAGVGLGPKRVIYAEAGTEAMVLLVMEEGLRHRGLCGVVGELARLPMTASRRLQLAAEASGVVGFVLRRWLKAEEPIAAATRWRITTLPSRPLPVPGVGRPRWKIDLIRCRGSEAMSWEVEGCDAQGRLAVPAGLAHGSAAQAKRSRSALPG